MVGKKANGEQNIPTTLKTAVPAAANPQKRLTMPLARVVHAITWIRVGLVVFISFS
jgi:hypothetical protein